MRGKIGGNFCSPLCQTGKFQYTKCLNYKGGKNIVFGHWNSKPVIVKSKYRADDCDFEAELGEVSWRNLLSNLRSKIKDEFDIIDWRSDKELVELLWLGEEDIGYFLSARKLTPREVVTQEALIRSLWSLVTQDEYFFFKYFSDNNFLPYVFGTCGSYYAVEYAPSTGVLDPDVFHLTRIMQHTWSERVKVAHDLLNVVRSLEEDFEAPVHLCDVKGSNFGISQDGIVKAIDTDTVFFRAKISKIIGDTEQCSADDDCHFFDCLGKCDVTRRKCKKAVVNNNLEVLERQTFSSLIVSIA